MNDTALVILAHGSRSPEAAEEFFTLSNALRLRFPGHLLVPAFMELAAPGFLEAVAKAVEAGARRVVVVPCFLFMGNHIKKDIPELIDEARQAFPKVEFLYARHVGPDPRLAEIVANRALESMGAEKLAGAAIEAQSMAIIETMLAQGRWSPAEYAVVKRLVHTAGDPLLASQIAFSPRAAEGGMAALSKGAPVVVDVKMVSAGLSRRYLHRSEIFCAIEEADAQGGEPSATTRSDAGMRTLLDRLEGAVVAIGNAPTALRALLSLMNEKGVRPALVVGMPVGFVDAAESKEALLTSGLPCIVVRGSRGGSPFAAAAVNALAKAIEET